MMRTKEQKPLMMDMDSIVRRLTGSGELKVVTKKLRGKLEAASVIQQAEPRPILLKNVQGRRVLANLFADRDALARHLGVKPGRFLSELQDILDGKTARPEAGDAGEEGIFGDEELGPEGMDKVPVLTYYEADGGPYITAGVWAYRDPEHGANLSYHRLMMASQTRGTVRVVENRGLDTALKNSGGKLDAAVCIGAPAHVLFAASLSPAMDVSELDLAAKFGRLDLHRCPGIDLDVPADCQAVIVGRFTGETGPEGPFVDITETMDPVRQQPVFEVTNVVLRSDPIHYTIIPGLSDHKTLMGIPKELDIYREVSKVCRCLDVRITPGGSSWLHAVVKIDKQGAEDGRKALETAFLAHKSMKYCVVVDRDIDCADPQQVEWSMATRFQADKDLLVLKDRPSSSLDPSATHEPGKKARGAKLGVDATVPSGADPKLFERYAG